MYRYIYSENEPIEKHPPRHPNDLIVLINKKTGFPEIGIIGCLGMSIYIIENGVPIKASPYYWEIAWP